MKLDNCDKSEKTFVNRGRQKLLMLDVAWKIPTVGLKEVSHRYIAQIRAVRIQVFISLKMALP